MAIEEKIQLKVNKNFLVILNVCKQTERQTDSKLL